MARPIVFFYDFLDSAAGLSNLRVGMEILEELNSQILSDMSFAFSFQKGDVRNLIIKIIIVKSMIIFCGVFVISISTPLALVVEDS